MYTKQEIILRHYVSGKSQRQISRELGLSRKTVRKYVSEYEEKLASGVDSQKALQVSLSTPVHYDVANRSKKKLTEEVCSQIDTLLESNAKKRATGLHKQVLKKIDIYHHLTDQGIDIGYTTICQYIKDKEAKRSKEVFIRQSYAPGSSCEYDWAEVKLEVGGSLSKYQLAVFTSCYSNYRYAVLYSRQDTLSFLEAHISFINHCRGAYRQMVYDNMRVAVAKFVGKHEKQPTQALLDLRSHYQFTHRFCNIYKGNEKGHVERSVEYIRRKSFGFSHQFDSLQQAENHLKTVIERINQTPQKLTGKSAVALFDEEKAHLRPFADPMECSQMEELRVDNYATISYKTNRYSVPEELVGEFVEAKIYSDKLIIYHKNTRRAQHSRSYGKHQWVINIEHYMETFKEKPGALAGSTALISNCYLKEVYEKHFYDQPRAFIDLLQYCYTKQIDQDLLASSLSKLKAITEKPHINPEALVALLGNHQHGSDGYGANRTSAIKELSKQHLQQIANLLSN